MCVDTRSGNKFGMTPIAKLTGTYTETVTSTGTTCQYNCQVCRECSTGEYERAPCLHANDDLLTVTIISTNGGEVTLTGGDLYLYVLDEGDGQV